MSHVRFTAWGSVDPESMDRMQRRKFLQAIRKELAEHGIHIDMGGQRENPHYMITWSEGENKKAFTQSGKNALKAVLEKALTLIPAEVTDERSEDGCVRSA